MKKLDKLIIIILNISLLIYIIIMGVIGKQKGWNTNIIGFKSDLWVLLTIMFIFELLSTFTFQTRLHLTIKKRYKLAAIVGASSWFIAGIQGMLLINGDIDGLHIATSFFIKMPSAFIATFSGIMINNYLKK